jgi:hypothetical protein
MSVILRGTVVSVMMLADDGFSLLLYSLLGNALAAPSVCPVVSFCICPACGCGNGGGGGGGGGGVRVCAECLIPPAHGCFSAHHLGISVDAQVPAGS